jgi:hypothetical protein
MHVEDPRADLESLFRELVGGQHRRQRLLSFRRFLDKKLTAPALANKVQKDIKVTVPVLGREIDVPYGFQNGRFNLIQPAAFRGASRNQLEITACKYAIEARFLYEHRDRKLGELRLVVVGEFGGQVNNRRPSVERILKENHVGLYTTRELDTLIEEIRRTGKELPSPT